MALVLADRVKETTTTTGTGTVTLAGAVTGYQSFSAVGNGNTTYYTIAGQGTSEWEVGIGTYTSSGTILSRTTVLASSNAGSLVSFSAGTKDVFVTYPAEKSVNIDASTNVDLGANSLNNVSHLGVNTTTVPDILLRAFGDNNSGSRIAVRGYSSDANSSSMRVTKFRGTYAAPQAPQSGDSLGKFEIGGYGTTSSSGYPQTSLEGLATEAWGATARGTKVVFKVTPNTTTTQVTALTIDQDSAATFAGTLSVAGTSSLGTTSTTYVQIVGDASYPMIKATGGTNTPLVLSPLGTGALQAQKTDSTATGGNARGANAVDWQTLRNAATQVASGAQSVVAGGAYNFASAQYASVLGGYANNVNSSYSGTAVGGYNNSNAGSYAFIGGGFQNTISAGTANTFSFIGGGYTNSANGIYNFIGAGQSNSGTSITAVTTQSATMNATTAVTLAASNASIKVGQYITGTSIAGNTYVAAISGTALTLSQAASGSSTSTLSFYTPHGVVVGGGNNQATGSYSFIGGGGDAGTAANRNVASGDWSAVVGGFKNTASGTQSFVGSGNNQTASGIQSFIGGGFAHTASGDNSVVGGGYVNQATGSYSSILGGVRGSTRSIKGYMAFPAHVNPIADVNGVSQAALIIIGKQTTDATATVLTCDNSAASNNNQVILPNNSAYYFKVRVIAGVTGAGNTKAWTLEGAIKRGAGVGTTAIVGTVITTIVAADAGASTWTVTATADTTNGGLAITVTGQASTTIRWVAKAETAEMTF